jgi:hypothetical protein
MLTTSQSAFLQNKLLTHICICILITLIRSTFAVASPQQVNEVKLEGELQSIKQAGFTYDDVDNTTSGNREADAKIKEIVDFVNKDEMVGVFALSMKVAFLNDERIADKSYKGNTFYILGRTSDGLPTGTIYLTRRLVNRAMEINKDLVYVLALHECAHIFHHWVLIRNGQDQDDPKMREQFDYKNLELACDRWAGLYANKFFKKKYTTPGEVDKVVEGIARDYSDQGDFFVADKSKVKDSERKDAFLQGFKAKPFSGPPLVIRRDNQKP